VVRSVLSISREGWDAFGSNVNIFLGSAVSLQVPSQISKVSVDKFCSEAFVIGGRPELFIEAPPE
jgi:hypothetical protein